VHYRSTGARFAFQLVFLLTSPYTCTLCPMFSLDPSVVGLVNPLHLLDHGQNHPIVCFAYLCRMIGGEFVFLSLLYIKLFKLGVEVAFNKRSAGTHNQVNLLKFSFSNSCSECTDDALMLLICCCLCTYKNPSSLSIDRLNSKIYPIYRASLIATPSSRLLQKQFTKKPTGSKLYPVF